MGHWISVKCNCPNRKPVPNNQWHDEPFRNQRTDKHRRAIVAEWRRSVRDMYVCGHRGGVKLEFSPAALFRLGTALDQTFKHAPDRFEIFRKIPDPRQYRDESLVLRVEEAELWELEIDDLRRLLSDEGYMGWKEERIWRQFWESHELPFGTVEKTLADAEALCRASRETGNPITFHW